MTTRLTYGDFTMAGEQDCGNAFDANDFDFGEVREGREVTAEEIVDNVISGWDSGDWISSQEDFDELDPHKAYEQWKSGWRSCAIKEVRSVMEEIRRVRLENLELFYLATEDYGRGDGDHGEIVEIFSDLQSALDELAHMSAGIILVGDGDGPHHVVAWTGQPSPKGKGLGVGKVPYQPSKELSLSIESLNRMHSSHQVHLEYQKMIRRFNELRQAARTRGFRKNPPLLHGSLDIHELRKLVKVPPAVAQAAKNDAKRQLRVIARDLAPHHFAIVDLTGNAAITYAETHGLKLNKYADPTEDARSGLSVDDAREIAAQDPSLIWVRHKRDFAAAFGWSQAMLDELHILGDAVDTGNKAAARAMVSSIHLPGLTAMPYEWGNVKVMESLGLDDSASVYDYMIAFWMTVLVFVDQVITPRDNPAPTVNSAPRPGWWRKPAPTTRRTCYATKSAALNVFLEANRDIAENYGGVDYEVSPSEFDAINHKYSLSGKRAVRTIAHAVWAAMPDGKPYCLDRIDLDTLNDTSPVIFAESGIQFRLPDFVYEAQAAMEEAERETRRRSEAWGEEQEADEARRHGGQSWDPDVEPSWVTEGVPARRAPSEISPMALRLEEQEPGVAQFRIFRDLEAQLAEEQAQLAAEQERRRRRTSPPVPRPASARPAPRPVSARPAPRPASAKPAPARARSAPPPTPYRLQLEEREPGVETYSINPRGNMSRRNLKENPAWVTNILSKHYEELEGEVPPKWLPKLTKTKGVRGNNFVAKLKEYGCGVYGCVLPTLDPEVVLKLTTDDTEAEFAKDLASNLTKAVTVRYHRIHDLPDKYKGRNTYLLWRDSANNVGELSRVVAEEGGDGVLVDDLIHEQHKAAQDVYDAFLKREPARELIAKWEVATKKMGDQIPELKLIADGMITNLHQDRVFMGDVHAGNIGQVGDKWLIIDPGNIAVLTEDA